MSEFSLESSIARARQRLSSPRQKRSDSGHSRLPQAVESELQKLLAQPERPSLSEVSRRLERTCRRVGCRPPARASLYNAIERAAVPRFALDELPEEVQRALYNIKAHDGRQPQVSGDQVVFHAFNYGCPRAISFASSLPWLCLHHALKRRGWRPKSRALLRAVMKFRGM